MINITLTPPEVSQLRAVLVPTAREIVTRKARVLLSLNDSLSVQEVADAYFLSTKTVYRYVETYRDGGLPALLAYHKPGGRHSRVPENIAQVISDALVRSPGAIESLDTKCHNWTLDLMQLYLEREHGLKFCRSYVGRLLQRHGFKCRYSRRVMTSPDPQYVKKRAVVDTLKKTWKQVRFLQAAGSSRAMR